MHVHYKLGPGGFNLAKHFLLHCSRMHGGEGNIIHVNIARSGVAMSIKIDFRFGTEDGDTLGW